MSKPLSEILSEALAIVEKAAPGELSVYDANEGDGWPPRPLWCFKNEAYDSEDEEAEVLQGSVNYGGKEDAEAIAAAINFLRQHGHALAALAQRVETACSAFIFSKAAPEPHQVSGLTAEDDAVIESLDCKRVALVPVEGGA